MFLVALPALAGEGMWLPQQIPQLAPELQKMGLKLDVNALADLTGDPLGAVISLGGCTASFVSPDGLIATNHHCAFGSIQHNSTPQNDLIEKGFVARTREQELPAAPGSKVWVTTKIEDVTAQMTGKLIAKMSDADRAKALDRRDKELVAECEKPGGLRCSVAALYEGSQYFRFTQAEISDVRLVYAPPRSVGEFGGEVDNFEWPRHTGDFSLLRAYVNGQPYKPAHWLKVAKTGVNEGDMVFVAGYPGRTFRLKTADEVQSSKEFGYPTSIRYFTDVMALLEAQGKGNKDVEIRNASRIKSLANSLKNYTSVNEGFEKDHIVEARQAREVEIQKAIAANPALAKYAKNIDEMSKISAENRKTRERDNVLTWLVSNRVSPMLNQAYVAARLASQRPKKDIDRVSGYQDRDVSRISQSSDRAQRLMDLGSDRAVLKYFLNEAAKLPSNQRLEAVDKALAATGESAVDAQIEKLLDRLYAGTKVADPKERAKMLTETTAQLKARGDSMIDFASSLLPLVEANAQRELSTTGAMSRLRPGYFELLRAVSGGNLYPDANSTLRVTFGTIQGYKPKDAKWYTPQTTLHGVVEKESGKEPFANPKSLLAAAADKSKTAPYIDREIGDVPVNFLSTCDTTGGNSGSPTLNANGEFIGLLFDGNYESIDADFLFNPAVTRSIHVDAQYMLWYLDAIDGATNLLQELGVQPKIAK
jgi:hypothetical protein